MERWMFNERVVISANRYPMWQRGGLCFRDNGGREANEVWDATLVIGKLDINLTLWRIGAWCMLLKMLPKKVMIGRLPTGQTGEK